jgi:hypothetical protein
LPANCFPRKAWPHRRNCDAENFMPMLRSAI